MTSENFIKAYLERDKWPCDRYEENFRYTGWSAETAARSMTGLAEALEKVKYEDKNRNSNERKDNRMIYHVKFEGSDKLYAYYCGPNVNLQVGCSYMIEADRSTTYKNPVTVIKIDNNKPSGVNIRVITHARLINGTKRPDDKIKRVVFNKEKRTTVVLWFDGQKTIVKQQDGDVWDEEKALAMCYMKRVLGNRGSFNETLKKYCNKGAENGETNSES